MNDSLFSVEGRIVAVTGGLGQLGRQFSRTLLERGARVAILDFSAESSDIPVSLQPYFENNSLLIIQTDVTQRNSLEQALDTVRECWGKEPFGLINNAALDSPPSAPPEETGPFETFPEASWDRVMDVNVKGVFMACQIFGNAMAQAGRGSIINIGSTYGIVSPDHRIYEYKALNEGNLFYKPVAYSASKSALVNFTKYVAVYWGKDGVRTNLMVLGGVFNHQDDEFLKGYCARVPMGRMANEDEYNGTVIYLMSDASSYMNGTTLTVDGGWTAW
jgi:NAD(P)-dependent dehydrogenase (short-subunit alcohol dehydrogenase family)